MLLRGIFFSLYIYTYFLYYMYFKQIYWHTACVHLCRISNVHCVSCTITVVRTLGQSFTVCSVARYMWWGTINSTLSNRQLRVIFVHISWWMWHRRSSVCGADLNLNFYFSISALILVQVYPLPPPLVRSDPSGCGHTMGSALHLRSVLLLLFLFGIHHSSCFWLVNVVFPPNTQVNATSSNSTPPLVIGEYSSAGTRDEVWGVPGGLKLMPLKIQMVICRMTTDTSTVKLRSNEDFFFFA